MDSNANISVKNRLARLQRQNFRSIPLREKEEEEKPVAKEIEDFKQNSFIKPVQIEELESSKVRERLEKLEKEPVIVPRALGEKPKEENTESPVLEKVEMALGKVESIKKKMHNTDNYLGLYYDLKKAEQELVDAVDGSVAAKVKIPSSVTMRVEALIKK